MRKVTIATFIVLACQQIAFADLKERKEKILKRIDSRIKMLEEKKGCVADAQDNKSLKMCHEKYKQPGKKDHPRKKMDD